MPEPLPLPEPDSLPRRAIWVRIATSKGRVNRRFVDIPLFVVKAVRRGLLSGHGLDDDTSPTSKIVYIVACLLLRNPWFLLERPCKKCNHVWRHDLDSTYEWRVVSPVGFCRAVCPLERESA